MKFKKSYIIIGTIALGLSLLGPAVGFAYYFFNSTALDNTLDQNYKYNNLKENSVVSNNNNEEYTIYFFPSSIYMYEYEKYLSSNGSEGCLPELLLNATGTTSNPMALEYYLDSSGNVAKSATTTASYSKLISQADEYISYIQTLCTTIGKDNTVTSGDYDLTAYHYVYSNLKYTSTAMYYGNSTTDGLFSLTDTRNSSSAPSRFNYKYKFIYDRFGYWSGLNAKVTSGSTGEEYGDQYYGRFSPIKMTVKGGINNKLYESLPIPMTSMSDGYTNKITFSSQSFSGRNWPVNLTIDTNGDYTIGTSKSSVYINDEYFDLTFSTWAYLSPTYTSCFYDRYEFNSNFTTSNVNGYNGTTAFETLASSSPKYEANYLLDPFRSVDCTNIFDLSKDLSYYADENNIIRLFPIYSNGKSYNATATGMYGGSTNSSNSFSDANLSHCGLAAARITYNDTNYSTLTSEDKYKRISNYIYNGDSAYLVTKQRNAWSGINDCAFSWVYYSSIKNFYYDSSRISNLTFSSASNSSELSQYNNFCTNTEIDTFLNNQLSTYGDGLYNFYFFYTHENINSISKWARVPNESKNNYTYNTNCLTGMGYYDNYVLAGGVDDYFRGRKYDEFGIATTGDNYKLAGISKREYNYKNFFNIGSEVNYMNYLIQNENSDGYYKDTTSEYFTDSSGNAYTYLDGTKKKKMSAYYHNRFEFLDSNNLIFMTADSLSQTGTYFGNLSYTDSVSNIANWVNSQIVIAIEKVNEIRMVSGTYNSDNFSNYSLLTSTTRPSYLNGLTTLLDPKRTFICFNQYISTNEPLSVVLNRTYTIPSSLINISTNSTVYFDIDTTAVSNVSDVDTEKIFVDGETYFTSNGSTSYVLSDSTNEGYFDFFFYKNDSDIYEVYVNKKTSYEIRLYQNSSFKQNLDSDGYLDLTNNSGLIWSRSYKTLEREEDKTQNPLTSSSTGTGTYSSTTLVSAISNYASSYNYTKGYIIRDYATNLVVGYYYNGTIKFIFNNSSDYSTFYVFKTSAFYLEEASYTM